MRRAIMHGLFLDQAHLEGTLLPLSLKERMIQFFRDRIHRFDQAN